MHTSMKIHIWRFFTMKHKDLNIKIGNNSFFFFLPKSLYGCNNFSNNFIYPRFNTHNSLLYNVSHFRKSLRKKWSR
ncbi:hypothetical protein PGB90_001986 [Kerria lacca]